MRTVPQEQEVLDHGSRYHFQSIVSCSPATRGREASTTATTKPDLNAHLERFSRSLKAECLHKLIPFGEIATRRAVRAFVTHCHTGRNHFGSNNDLIVPINRLPVMEAEIETTEYL